MRALALAAPDAIMATMRDEPDPSELDLDGFYERYLKTCAMSGVTPRTSQNRTPECAFLFLSSRSNP